MANGEAGGIAGALLAFEQTAVTAAANRVREAGDATLEGTRELVAALTAAAAMTGALTCGATLSGCADLLARRVQDAVTETAGVADGMEWAAGMLTSTDQEVAGHVSDAAG